MEVEDLYVHERPSCCIEVCNALSGRSLLAVWMYIWLSFARVIRLHSVNVSLRERTILKCFTGTVLAHKVCSQACEWTGNCAIEGCKHRCEVQDSVGRLSGVLRDRAWDLDWWAVCPYLAKMVQTGLWDSADSPTPAGSGEFHIPCLLQIYSFW
jgi:hypothetical protein